MVSRRVVRMALLSVANARVGACSCVDARCIVMALVDLLKVTALSVLTCLW